MDKVDFKRAVKRAGLTALAFSIVGVTRGSSQTFNLFLALFGSHVLIEGFNGQEMTQYQDDNSREYHGPESPNDNGVVEYDF